MKARRTGEHVVRYEVGSRQYYKSVLDGTPVELRVSKRKFGKSGDAEQYHWRFWAKLKRVFLGKG